MKIFFSYVKLRKIHQLDIIKKLKGYKKRLAKGIKIFRKKKKIKSNYMVANDIQTMVNIERKG